MNILTKSEFLEKKSDTAVIFGSGSSINDLSKNDIEELMSFDTFGFNWICKSGIAMDFYMLREQANTHKRTSVEQKETPQELIKTMNDSTYRKSCIIINDPSGENEVFNYAKSSHRLLNSGVILNDINYGKIDVGKYREDIFEHGVYHIFCSLSNMFHIVIYMQYKRLLLVGFDLYDSKYFWLKDKVRHTVSSTNMRHRTSKPIMALLKELKKQKELDMFVYNPESLLSSLLPVWR